MTASGAPPLGASLNSSNPAAFPGSTRSVLHATGTVSLGFGEQAGLELWSLSTAALDPGSLDDSLLDRDERRRSVLLRSERERTCFVASHLLLRELLARRLECRPEEIAYVRERCPVCGGRHGRPALAGWPPALHFSLSRSGEAALVALAAVPVGVDLQEVVSASYAAEVCPLLHPQERAEILAASARRRPAVFTQLWTRKEAYLKGIGSGIAGSLERDSLATLSESPAGWRVVDVPLGTGFAAAVALRSG